MKLSKKELTQAIARFARRHNHYACFVRTNTFTRQQAVQEWLEYQRQRALQEALKNYLSDVLEEGK